MKYHKQQREVFDSELQIVSPFSYSILLPHSYEFIFSYSFAFIFQKFIINKIRKAKHKSFVVQLHVDQMMRRHFEYHLLSHNAPVFQKLYFAVLQTLQLCSSGLDLVSNIGSMSMLASCLRGQDVKRELFNKKTAIFIPYVFKLRIKN